MVSVVSSVGLNGSAVLMFLLAVGSLGGALARGSAVVLIVFELVLAAALLLIGLGVLRRRLWGIVATMVVAFVMIALGVQVFTAAPNRLATAFVFVYGWLLLALVLMSRTAFE